MSVQLEKVVFCEDIRQEVGGTFSLIGVFNGTYNIGKFPFLLKSRLWICMSVSDTVSVKLQFRIICDLHDKEHFKSELIYVLSKNLEEGRAGNGLALPVVANCWYGHAGNFSIEMKKNDDEWQNIAILKLIDRTLIAPSQLISL